MERSDIGTIHSFAATLLRLYPLEAGVDPQFHEDDGAAFDRLFDEHWDLWLDQELSLRSSHAEDWRKILAALPARSNQSFGQIDFHGKRRSSAERQLGRTPFRPPCAIGWLSSKAKAASLIERHPEDRLNEKLVRAAARGSRRIYKNRTAVGPIGGRITRCCPRKRSVEISRAGRPKMSPKLKSSCAPPRGSSMSMAN